MKLRQPRQRKRWRRDRKNGTTKASDGVLPLSKRPWYWWFTWLIFLAILTWAAYPIVTSWGRIQLERFQVGQPSPHTFVSPVTVRYEDPVASKQAQAQAMSDVSPVYQLDTRRLADVPELFRNIRQIREQAQWSQEEKLAQLRKQLLIGHLLSQEVLARLLRASEEQLRAAETELQGVLASILKQGVIRDGENGDGRLEFAADVAQRMRPYGPKWEAIRERLRAERNREISDAEVASEIQIELSPGGQLRKVGELYTWSEAKAEVERRTIEIQDETVRRIVSEMGQLLIRPNVLQYDQALTQERRQSVAQAIAPVIQEIRKGQTIVEEGQIVTQQHRQMLQAIHNYMLASGMRRRAMIRTAAGIALLLTLLTGLSFVYLYRYRVETFQEYRKLLAFCLAILLTTVTGKAFLMAGQVLFQDGSLTFDLVLVIPAAITSALVVILFDASTAIVATLLVAVVIGSMGAGQFDGVLSRVLTVVAAGLVTIFTLFRVRRRRELTLAGLYVALVNVLCVVGFSLIGGRETLFALQNVGVGVFNGLLVAVVTPGLLPVFEAISQVTTDIKLLELSDLNHPLLKELEQRANGTYHHSMNVSKLAEAAAKAIGANELLARVGAYYHDIGKMNHPRYFTENQEGGANPHDKLGPMRSAKIIANHVIDGIQMAQAHKLPKVIEAMIPEHHGTSLISFFHLKALQSDKNADFQEEDFRYVGPKPRSKESSIMMLADSVEAASRSLYSRVAQPTPKDIRELIQQIINKKIAEGQLDQSPLTLKDLKIIAESFERVLCGLYHSRIDYPQGARMAPPAVKAVQANGVDKQRPDYSVG